VGAQTRAGGGAHRGDRVLCSQWPAHSGLSSAYVVVSLFGGG
jgi:hypothetical protein